MKDVNNTKDDDESEDPKSALLIRSNGDLNAKRKLKVQWNDTHGKELTSVWKFQPSDSSDSDDDDEHSQACSCAIM